MRKKNEMVFEGRTSRFVSVFYCIAFGVVLQRESEAITITISPGVVENSVTIGLTGSLFLVDAISAESFPALLIPAEGGGFNLLGDVESAGQLSASPFLSSQLIGGANLGSGVDTARFNVVDSSSGDTLVGGQISGFLYGVDGSFALTTNNVINFPDSIDFGDELVLSGELDIIIPTGGFFNTFSEGIYAGEYNNQSTTVLVGVVPEPSVSLMCSLLALGVWSRSR